MQYCLFALALGALSLASALDAAPASQDETESPGPLPHAVRLGDTLESFTASLPEAQPTTPGPSEGEAGTKSLVLNSEADPIYGLPMLADFGFREDRLYEFVAVWKSSPEKVASPRRRFWRDCLTQHGADYERCLLPVFVKEGEERQIPAACWRTPVSLTLAYCVDQRDETAPGRSMMVYAQFQPDDPTLARNLTPANPASEEHMALWRDMDALIRGEAAPKE